MQFTDFNNIPKNKYQIIYADPGWKFNNKNTGGSMSSGSAQVYKTVTGIDALKEIPVTEISKDDAVLFMWWVSSMPQEALDLVKAWGFTIKTMTGFTWVKRTKNWKLFFGMGFWTRAGSENCLIAVRGDYPRRINAGVRSVIEAKVEEHSKKPAEVRQRIVQLMGDLPRIELFARETGDNFDAWGDEIE